MYSQEYLKAKEEVSNLLSKNNLKKLTQNINFRNTNKDFNKLFDYSFLNPRLECDELNLLFKEALILKPKSICIPPNRVNQAIDFFTNENESDIIICSVVGFPNGYSSIDSKVFEAEEFVRKMKQNNLKYEIDMVISNGHRNNLLYLYGGISSIAKAAENNILKVALETTMLNEEEIYNTAFLSIFAGASHLKTSTTFAKPDKNGNNGATLKDCKILREVAGDNIGVKASGNINTYKDVLEYINIGVDRIETSSLKDIINQKNEN